MNFDAMTPPPEMGAPPPLPSGLNASSLNDMYLSQLAMAVIQADRFVQYALLVILAVLVIALMQLWYMRKMANAAESCMQLAIHEAGRRKEADHQELMSAAGFRPGRNQD